MNRPETKKTRLDPWPDQLSKDPAEIAKLFQDLVTCLENNHSAFIRLGDHLIENGWRQNTISEIRNLANVIRMLCPAFDLNIDELFLSPWASKVDHE